jgi:hypothetical protein
MQRSPAMLLHAEFQLRGWCRVAAACCVSAARVVPQCLLLGQMSPPPTSFPLFLAQTPMLQQQAAQAAPPGAEPPAVDYSEEKALLALHMHMTKQQVCFTCMSEWLVEGQLRGGVGGGGGTHLRLQQACDGFEMGG